MQHDYLLLTLYAVLLVFSASFLFWVLVLQPYIHRYGKTMHIGLDTFYHVDINLGLWIIRLGFIEKYDPHVERRIE